MATAKKRNIINDQVVVVQTMQSEGGAAGAVHGALAAGGCSSTFTASQGLLLMIPNLYLIAGELMPTVFHIAARTVAKHALSIYNDHSDVMACRQTGFAQLCANNVQEVMDLALVSHLATMKGRVPVMHFFDGNRVSAEISKVDKIHYDDMKQLFHAGLLQNNLRRYGLNPTSPISRGIGQRPDIFFQNTVLAQQFYDAFPGIVQETMDEVGALTGRKYKLFDYVGHPEPKDVMVIMGSAADTVEQYVRHLVQTSNEAVGVMKVHLYRPWSAAHLLEAMPKSVERVSVLDRTREDGASGNPLFLDVCVTINEAGRHPLITGGTYGLSSKELTPAMVQSILDNARSANPRRRYVIGIHDDVTNTSLKFGKDDDASLPSDITQAMLWGFGQDGSVGASKQTIKTLSDNTNLNVQGFYEYDSHKGGGVTISHLRFGESEIKAKYSVKNADFVACHKASYIKKYDIVDYLKPNSTFLLNSPWNTIETIEKEVPDKVKRILAEKNTKFYNIDASKIAYNQGLGQRINMIMQTCFYRLSGVLPFEEALDLQRKAIQDVYGRKGPKIVKANIDAAAAAVSGINEIEYDREKWMGISQDADMPDLIQHWNIPDNKIGEYCVDLMEPIVRLKGDDLPVSSLVPGGFVPSSTTKYEKRGIAEKIPVWYPDKCTQCNYCAITCPHAVIRPFLASKQELKDAPATYPSRKAQGQELAGLNYSIVISPMDCTGCEVCVQVCPDDALEMQFFDEVAADHRPWWDFAEALPQKEDKMDKFTVKGSQFQEPFLEFHGACAGCGETPYMKLATQLFGKNMVIANASGCSSVWGGTCGSQPYSVDKDGHGPAWGRSLFEDNAEYGYGMYLSAKARYDALKEDAAEVISEGAGSDELRSLLGEWKDIHVNDLDKGNALARKITKQLVGEFSAHPTLERMWNSSELFRPQSHWLVGGDGWAYDIGFGGLDHVLAKGENVNILIMDTEMYSNTGGQISKSTPQAAVVKFASSGNPRQKKDLGLIARTYENIYVASVAMGANYNQSVKAFREAQDFPGPSIILAYSPCIDWGIDMKYMMEAQKLAVESGYWNLYRYDPRKATPMQLDSKKNKVALNNYLNTENRFSRLIRTDNNLAVFLQSGLGTFNDRRQEMLKRESLTDLDLMEYLAKRIDPSALTGADKVAILYASETGTAEQLASEFSMEFARRDMRTMVGSLDDFDFDELATTKDVVILAATCGQGEFPGNSKTFWDQIQKDHPADMLKDTNFYVFGLGDSHYVHFNYVAKELYNRLEALGGNMKVPIGMGDDQHEDKFETELEEWMPTTWGVMGAKEPEKVLLPPSYKVKVTTAAETDARPKSDFVVPPGGTLLTMKTNKLLSPDGYERDIRHYEFNIKDTGVAYEVGDSLGVYAHNSSEQVSELLNFMGLHHDDILHIEDQSDKKDPLPTVMTAEQLFGQVLDMFGKPKRRFYEMMSIISEDDEDRQKLETLISMEGKEDYRTFVNETMTVFDIIKMFPSCRPTIENLIDYVPRIKPRLYSIASSPAMTPDEIHLCVIVDDWTTPGGRYKKGLCSDYLTGHKEGTAQLATRINPGVIEMPPTHETPFILTGLGTGIAPIMSIMEDRVVAHNEGVKTGPMALFFGTRNSHAEYTYGEYMESLVDRGILTHLKTAFSRDQAKKVYVQDRVRENPEIIYDYLVKQNGMFYYCGTGGAAPERVKDAVTDALTEASGSPRSEMEDYVTQMQIDGRWNVEAW